VLRRAEEVVVELEYVRTLALGARTPASTAGVFNTQAQVRLQNSAASFEVVGSGTIRDALDLR